MASPAGFGSFNLVNGLAIAAAHATAGDVAKEILRIAGTTKAASRRPLRSGLSADGDGVSSEDPASKELIAGEAIARKTGGVAS